MSKAADFRANGESLLRLADESALPAQRAQYLAAAHKALSLAAHFARSEQARAGRDPQAETPAHAMA